MANKPQLLPLPVRSSTELTSPRSRTGLIARTRSDMSQLSIRELRAAVAIDGKWGLINQFGKFVLEPVHYAIRPFSCGRAAFSDSQLKFSESRHHAEPSFFFLNYLTRERARQEADPFRIRVDENEPSFWDQYDGARWGFLDCAGETVIEPRFKDVRDFSEGLAAVTFEHRDGFIDTMGKTAVEPRFGIAGDFRDGVALVSLRRRFGFIDRLGQFVIPPIFDYAWEFSEGLACVSIKDKFGYIDKAGSLAIPPTFDAASDFQEGVALVCAGETYALIDTLGHIQFQCYEKNQALTSLSESLAVVSADDPVYYCHCEHGRNCADIECQDSFCKCKVGNSYCDECSDCYGYFVDRFGTVTSDDGRLTRLNNLQDLAYAFTTPQRFDWGEYYPGRDRESHIRAIANSRFLSAQQFRGGRAPVEIREGKWSIVDAGGEIIGDRVFDYVRTLKEEIALVWAEERCGYIDKNGAIVTEPQFSWGRNFSCGLAAVRDGGNWGYIDKTGRLVIPCQFSDARDFQQVGA